MCESNKTKIFIKPIFKHALSLILVHNSMYLLIIFIVIKLQTYKKINFIIRFCYLRGLLRFFYLFRPMNFFFLVSLACDFKSCLITLGIGLATKNPWHTIKKKQNNLKLKLVILFKKQLVYCKLVVMLNSWLFRYSLLVQRLNFCYFFFILWY